jgi:hypothetical protein
MSIDENEDVDNARTLTLGDDLTFELLVARYDTELDIVAASGHEPMNNDGSFVRIVG